MKFVELEVFCEVVYYFVLDINLNFAKIQNREKLLPMAKVAQKLPSTIGTGLLLSKMVYNRVRGWTRSGASPGGVCMSNWNPLLV